MPAINLSLELPDEVLHALQEEYKKMAIAWPRPGQTALPPGFEEWLGERLADAATALRNEEVRLFSALEKLVTQLQPHGFALAHLGIRGTSTGESARALSACLVDELRLPPTQRKRIEELLGYYARSAKDVADMGHVALTNRAYGALHEACRDLLERTGSALERLGEERAIGRAEGAIAMLVSLGAMDRTAGKEKAESFKEQVRRR